MRTYEIGAAEFARIVGIDSSEVSHAATAGLLTVHSVGPNRKGPGSRKFDLLEAQKIAAAVKVGIPWLGAVRMIDRIEIFESGIIIRHMVTEQETRQ